MKITRKQLRKIIQEYADGAGYSRALSRANRGGRMFGAHQVTGHYTPKRNGIRHA